MLLNNSSAKRNGATIAGTQMQIIAVLAIAAGLTGTAEPKPIDRVAVGQLCNAVADQLRVTDQTGDGDVWSNGRKKFSYEEILYAAAGVSGDTDSPEQIAQKMQSFWEKNWTRMYCDQLGFSITNGPLLWLAVERYSKEFINDVIRRWKLDINRLASFYDSERGGCVRNATTLDYIDDLLKRYPADPPLERIRELFERKGGKRSATLQVQKQYVKPCNGPM